MNSEVTTQLKPGSLVIRRAETPDELERLYRFRYSVYVEELGRRISCADHSRGMLIDELDDTAVQFCAMSGDRIVGCLRGHIGTHAHLPGYQRRAYQLDAFAHWPADTLTFTSRLMVHPRWRRSRCAALLALEWYGIAGLAGFLFNFMHCAPALLPLFRHFGYECYGEPFLEPEIGLRHPMVLVRKGRAELERIGSPFATVTQEEADPRGCVSWFKNRFPNQHLYAKLPLAA